MTEQIEIGYPVFVIGPQRLADSGPVGAALQFVDSVRGRCLLIFESPAKAMEAISGMSHDDPLAIMQIDDRKEFEALLAADERSSPDWLD